jgi:hypothetical protein
MHIEFDYALWYAVSTEGLLVLYPSVTNLEIGPLAHLPDISVVRRDEAWYFFLRLPILNEG